MRKGEIACYKRFLLFSQCFPQLYIISASNVVLCGNSLPNDNILEKFKLKGIADNKIKVLKIIIFAFDWDENIAGKGENAGYYYFLLFWQYFQNTSFVRVIKGQDSVVRS